MAEGAGRAAATRLPLEEAPPDLAAAPAAGGRRQLAERGRDAGVDHHVR